MIETTLIEAPLINGVGPNKLLDVLDEAHPSRRTVLRRLHVGSPRRPTPWRRLLLADTSRTEKRQGNDGGACRDQPPPPNTPPNALPNALPNGLFLAQASLVLKEVD